MEFKDVVVSSLMAWWLGEHAGCLPPISQCVVQILALLFSIDFSALHIVALYLSPCHPCGVLEYSAELLLILAQPWLVKSLGE